jgi:hypothetical protein
MTTPAPKRNPLKHLKASDLRAAAQLATLATQGVANITEGVHQAVLSTLGSSGGQREGQTGGLTGMVYATVRGVTQLVGMGVAAALSPLEASAQALLDQLSPAGPSNQASTPEREAVLAALNGVLGDQLHSTGNPLATTMALRYRGVALDFTGELNAGHACAALADATDKLLVVIHGLCMNDLQWEAGGHNHATLLAQRLGYTPVYLRYNTGLHTSQNGELLERLLSQLVQAWPVPLKRLSVLVHSMGGLVIRSAVASATTRETAPAWLQQLSDIVFLGTPHHGAPLEQAGNWVDVILGSTPYSKPFAKLGQLRSAGITDLRHGNLRPSDWQDTDRFQRAADARLPTPLPPGVACYAVAATVVVQRSKLSQRVIGDGLVPLPSALGQHPDPAHRLQFAAAARHIALETNHMQLLSRPEIGEQLVQWLTSDAAQGNSAA